MNTGKIPYKKLDNIKVAVDLGGGDIDAYFPNILCRYVEKLHVVDCVGTGKTKGNITSIVMNIEKYLGQIQKDLMAKDAELNNK